MNKMLVSDYDQTFYISDENIENNKKYVNEFKKNPKNIFVIATGRSYLDFYKKQEEYNFYFDYAILNHGATIIDNKNNVLMNIMFENSIIPELKDLLNLDKSIKYFCCSGIESRVEFEHQNLTKINVKYMSKEYAFSILELVNERLGNYLKAYYVNNNSIEIISNKINKALAIYEIMNLNNIDKNNVYTVGDGYSDIDMIKEFNGYGMKESINEIKNLAIGQVDSVSDLIKMIIE